MVIVCPFVDKIIIQSLDQRQLLCVDVIGRAIQLEVSVPVVEPLTFNLDVLRAQNESWRAAAGATRML